MVHLKASTGCDKCRERRIKCDEGKPACNRCTKRGIACPGYRSFGGVVFVDAGKAFNKAKPGRRSQEPVSVDEAKAVVRMNPTRELILDPQNLSIHFFFQNVVLSPERDPLLSRGHFDNLLEMYCSAPSSAPISLAASVMAACVFQQFHNQTSEASWQIRHQMEAHAALKRAIVDPKESLRDETLMAIVLMDFAARLSADKGAQAAAEVHMTGALALADKRGDASFVSKSSQALLAALRSNVLLYSLWKGDEEGYNALKKVPNVKPNADSSLAAALHYLLAKAIILDTDAGTAKIDASNGGPPVDAAYWTETASQLVIELDEWYERTPSNWKHAVGYGSDLSAGEHCPNLPSMQILYILGQWHCIKLNLIKIIGNVATDAYKCRQAHAQGRIVFENLRSLFPHFEAEDMVLYDQKPMFVDFMHHAASYAAPVPAARLSVYRTSAPSGQHYLLNLMKWTLTHVENPEWSLQPRAEWIPVKDYLIQEKERIVADLDAQARVSKLAQLF